MSPEVHTPAPTTPTEEQAPQGIFRDESSEQATEAPVADTETLPEVPVTDEARVSTEVKDGKKGKKVVAWAAAGATVLTAAVVGIGAALGGNRTSAEPTPLPSASGPLTPGPTGGETSTPVSSESPSSEPTASETTASEHPSASPTESESPSMPFDTDAVNTMKDEGIERFNQNSGPLRLQYYLNDAYEQETMYGTYGDFLDQKMKNGRTLSDYNPFSSATLTKESKPQDILNAYVYGQAYIMAQEDPEQARKLISGFVRDPNSAEYKGFELLIDNYPHTKMGEKSANDIAYDATGEPSKVFSEVNKKTGQKETHMRIQTRGGYVFDFVFVPVPELSKLNLEDSDDAVKDAGIWLSVSSTKL